MMKNKFKIIYPSFHYLITGIILAIVGGVPGVLFSNNLRQILHNDYVGWYFIYWFLIAAIYVMLVIYFRRKRIEKPVKKIGKAAQKVANGDFSVYLKPPHGSYPYMQQLYADFNHMVEELGSTETLKNDFLGNVSHEFKAPLAIIKSYTHALKNDELSAKERQASLDIISRSADNLSSLVTDILRLNNLSNQSILVNLKDINISNQLADIALDLEPHWSDKQIEVSADLDDDCAIYSDESMLAIVWNNLLNNAIKYSQENGKIFISDQILDDGIRVDIKDEGMGMNKAIISHIFDQFYQGDTSHRQSGNGLGLSMVKKILDKLGGTISVTSSPGHGSLFSVWLPNKVR